MRFNCAPALIAAAVVASLSLAGCTTSNPGSGSPEHTPDVDSPAQSVDHIEAYLAAAENDWKAATRVNFAANQDKIATCMVAAGFQYIPNSLPEAPPTVNKNTEEWISQHGYGMSAEDRKDQELLDILDTAYGVEDPEQTAYLDNLSDAEKDAYFAALYGDGDESLSEESGCMADQPIDPRFTPAAIKLAEQSFDYQNAAAADPETVQAKDDWAACMVEAGHDGLGEPDDAYAEIDAIYNPQTKVDSVEGKIAEDGSTDRSGETSILSDAELAAARQAEIAMALDDFDCKVSTQYTERVTGVLYALEDEWISSHQAELDDVIAGYREASK